ncbi:MAG: tight adherence protein [Pseudonocardiales bacterium]|jgi:tight adherence protein B|nr:tight adherence protein [Pseudonocardiales bacterium]
MQLIVVLVFAGIVFGVLAATYTPAIDRRRRLREAAMYRVQRPEETAPSENRGITRIVLRLADRVLQGRRKGPELAEELSRAGIGLGAQEWMVVRLSAGVVCVAVVLFASGSFIMAVPIGLLLTFVSFRMYLKIKLSKRCAAFADQLPDVLQLVAASLRSGFSLNQALDAVVHQGEEPCAPEIGRALAEARLGVDIEDALDKAADRMRCRDLSWVVMAVRISRQVGGNLSEVLVTTVHTMRERAQLRRQVRSLSAEGRLSAYVLVAMPIGVSAWLFAVRREYLRPLWTTVPGIGMLIAALLGILIGAWWLSRVVKIEV